MLQQATGITFRSLKEEEIKRKEKEQQALLSFAYTLEHFLEMPVDFLMLGETRETSEDVRMRCMETRYLKMADNVYNGLWKIIDGITDLPTSILCKKMLLNIKERSDRKFNKWYNTKLSEYMVCDQYTWQMIYNPQEFAGEKWCRECEYR